MKRAGLKFQLNFKTSSDYFYSNQNLELHCDTQMKNELVCF